ncbi:MAG: CheR family methyltransferase [Planctomycetaceae bacterium]
MFKILGDLIHERIGLHYDVAKRDLLAEKLSPLAVACGFSSFLDYYYLLKYGPDADQHWPSVVDALSVQETYFWREMSQVHALVDTLIPRFMAESPNQQIRIWCAACATGEEPLTIAIALAEAGWWDRAEIQILASDASGAALTKARNNRFRERSFRSLPLRLRDKYFTCDGDDWQAKTELFSRITWAQANLVEATDVQPLVHAQFVFCRNVFIYFAEETITRTLQLFSQGMVRPGYLFVGAAESLLKLTDEFELTEVGDAFLYALK